MHIAASIGILFLRTLSCLTMQKKKQVVAAAQACSGESASITLSRTVDEVAPWAKVASLYGTRRVNHPGYQAKPGE